MWHCLVTGGAGFIGSHLVEGLLARGHRVRVLDNFASGKPDYLAAVEGQIELHVGDVGDPQSARQAMDGIEVVFHHAALASVPLSVEEPLKTHAACATGTLNLLDAARRAGVRRFVYAGSSSAYGQCGRAVQRESDPVAPISPYGAAKLAGEMYCRAFAATYGFSTVVLRYFNVYGPRQDPDSPYSAVIPRFVTALLEGRPPTVFGDGTQSRDFCYVGDVVHANLLAAQAADVSGEVFNIATGRSVTLLELLEHLRGLLGVEIQPQFAPPRPGDIHRSVADISLARRRLSYEPQVSLLEGLRLSIDYYRAATRPDRP